MSFVTYDYLARSRHQELIGDAQRARLARCLQPPRRWRRRLHRPCT
ncbi:hypothetical protein [Blastococcus sp. VKM Ac-2987]|nr:hypothetical protein [Blastococcus sp. VKM Ac-2987]MCZ2860818.1 hypothetical protein [Blastococcus sp. VKM Ac-2987]